MRKLPLLAALGLAAFSGASTASAAPLLPPLTAPGRVALDVNGGAISENVDGGTAISTVALPDGGALLFGTSAGARYTVVIAHIDRAGKPAADVARLDFSAQKFSLQQVIRRPDGRLLLVGTQPAADVTAGQQLVIAQLTAAGALDSAFGSGGFAATGVTSGCGGVCNVAALGPDGKIAVAGYSGKISPLPAPGDYSGVRWVVAQRNADGSPDTSFGAAGVATLPTAGAIGLNVAVLSDGRVVSDASVGGVDRPASMQVTRLSATGAPDAAFNAGNPVSVPLQAGFPMLAQQDGSVLVIASHIPGPAPALATTSRVMVRFNAAGAPDPGFGSGGVAELGSGIDPQQILTAAGGAYYAVSTTGLANGALTLRHVAANGALAPALDLTVPLVFGGGGSSFQVSKLPRPLPSLAQNSFRGAHLVERSDGSFIVGDGVSVTTPTGEGAGRSIFRFAAASLTPTFTTDPAFGGPAATPRVRVSVALQRRTTARTRHGIRVKFTSSVPGLALVKVRAAGVTVAQAVVPVFKIGTQTLPVELSKSGNTLLGHSSRRLHVTVTTTIRDLVGTEHRAPSAEGALH